MSSSEWDEVKRLAADFQRAQLAQSVQRFVLGNKLWLVTWLRPRSEGWGPEADSEDHWESEGVECFTMFYHNILWVFHNLLWVTQYSTSVSVSRCITSVSPLLEFFFQEQSYSSQHSERSLAWDHVRGDIDDPCSAFAEVCGVIADPCGVVAIPPHGKLESGSTWEVQQVLRIIYNISGSRKMALDLVRFTEKARSLAPPPGHWKWRKACINTCKHILKFSNCVLLRVPINNNNYEPIALFVIILAKNTFTNQHGVIYCWRQVGATVTTSIVKSWCQVDLPTRWLQHLLQ